MIFTPAHSYSEWSTTLLRRVNWSCKKMNYSVCGLTFSTCVLNFAMNITVVLFLANCSQFIPGNILTLNFP